MSRISPTLSRLTREPDVKSSQQPSLRLPVQKVVQAYRNAENIVLSKASQLLHYGAIEFGNLHHGSRENRISGQSEKKQTSVLHARWTCPPKFILNENWLVAAGEQSEEIKVQEQREARLTQSIYSHPYAIPPSPPVSSDLEYGHLDDDEIAPLIPVEEAAFDSSCEAEPPSSTKESFNMEMLHQRIAPVSNPMASASEPDASKPCTGAKDPVAALTGLDADISAAASAAFTALMKSYERGNLIDTELLIKLLSDPRMIELLKDTGPLALSKPMPENSDMIQPSLNTPSILPLNCLSSFVTRNPVKESSSRLPTSVSDTSSPSVPLSRSTRPDLTSFIPCVDMSIPKTPQPLPQKLENVASESFPASKPPASSNTMFGRSPTSFPHKPISTDSVSLSADKSSSSVKVPPPPLKDASYLKSLVRQHGVERLEVEGPRRKPKTTSSSFSNLGESRNQLTHPKGQGNGKPKASSKPCMYYSGPKGCRLGLSCPFRHDLLYRQSETGGVSGASGFKRIKL